LSLSVFLLFSPGSLSLVTLGWLRFLHISSRFLGFPREESLNYPEYKGRGTQFQVFLFLFLFLREVLRNLQFYFKMIRETLGKLLYCAFLFCSL
jgi:hypothetical protein